MLRGCITGIAEVSLRVHNLEVMRKFYEEVLGLQIAKEFDDYLGRSVHYVIGDPAGMQRLALYEETYRGWMERDRSSRINVKQSTLHHLSFHIAPADFDAEKQRLEQMGIAILRAEEVTGMRTHRFYFADPEGNIIEFRSVDPPAERTEPPGT